MIELKPELPTKEDFIIWIILFLLTAAFGFVAGYGTHIVLKFFGIL